MTAHQIIVHRGSVPSGSGSVDAVACQKLWRAVLAEQGLMALGAWVPGDQFTSTAERQSARDWFGSRSFYTVCALAGFDGEYILRKYRARVATPDALRGPLRRGRGKTMSGGAL